MVGAIDIFGVQYKSVAFRLRQRQMKCVLGMLRQYCNESVFVNY